MIKLSQIRVVLVNTSHPGNIGSTARAMANMGLTKLVLVDPVEFPSERANAMAAGADQILDSIEVFDNLAEAVQGCSQVYGASARLRSISWPQYDPRELSVHITTTAGDDQVALVFGRERSGLSNDELDLCEGLVNIPVDDMHRSLNLAAAVMVVAYELKMATFSEADRHSDVGQKNFSEKATSAQLQYFFERWDATAKSVDFYKGNPETVMRKVRKVFYKADLTDEEVKILLGVLTAIDLDLKKA